MPDEFATNWFFVGFGGDSESFFFLLTSYRWTVHFTDSHRSLTAPYLQIPGSCIDVIVRLIQGSIGTVQVMIDEPADLSVAEKMANNTFCDLSCMGSCSAPGLKNCVVVIRLVLLASAQLTKTVYPVRTATLGRQAVNVIVLLHTTLIQPR
jgi:hypothetical protein